MSVCIKRLVTGSSPTVNEVWTPDSSRPPTPTFTPAQVSKPPLRWHLSQVWERALLQQHTQKTHSDTREWLGLENVSPSHQILRSIDYQVWRTRTIKWVPFLDGTLATVSAELFLGLSLRSCEWLKSVYLTGHSKILALLFFTYHLAH